MSADLEDFVRSQPLIKLPSDHVTEEEEDSGCRTPRSPAHVIPLALVCPPAPRKPYRRRVQPGCKRRLFELRSFELVAGEEIEAFFRAAEEEIAAVKKRRCVM